MVHDPIPSLLQQIDPQRMKDDLFYLSKDPLPFRKLNYILPGHRKSTLHEADDYIQARLESCGYAVEREACQVQAFRRNRTKPPSRQYATPDPGDPWYTGYNLYAKKPGATHPSEIVVVISHKDSQSWIDSPGAYDNAAGTVANMEIARILQPLSLPRSVWFVYCNEEHTPWTSVTAARNARQRGDNIVALFNIDGIGAKSQADIDARRLPNVAVYVDPPGKQLADLLVEVNDAYRIGLRQSVYHAEHPGDDHGSYIKEGFLAAIGVIGSMPYADPNYHQEGDTPEAVDMENVTRATRACLAAIVKAAGG